MTRLSALLAASILAFSASPALASGGKGGGGLTTPAPDVDPCEGYWELPEIVNRTAGGCVIVAQTSPTTLRLDRVILLPGWSYVVESNGEGTNSRVQVSFANASTGAKAEIRVEFGKTVIR